MQRTTLIHHESEEVPALMEQTEEWKPQRLWNTRYIQLLAIETMMQFGLFVARPVASSFAVQLGASVALAGFIAGLLATASAVVRPASGVLSDFFSKKSLLTFSAGTFMVSSIGVAFAPSVPMMIACGVLQGIAFAFKSTVVVSMTSLVVPKEQVGTGVGWLSIGYTVACSLGPAIGSFLSARADYFVIYLISALLLGIGFVLAVLFKTPKGAEAQIARSSTTVGGVLSDIGHAFNLKTMFHIPTLPYSLIAGLLMVAQGTVNSFLLYVQNIGLLEGAAFYFVIYAVITLATKPAAGRFADKYGVAKVVPPMLVVAAIGMISLAISGSVVSVVIAAICMGVGQGSAYSATQAESVRGVDKEFLGRSANTYFLGPDIGMGLGPILTGAILDATNSSFMFITCAIFIGLALVVFVIHQTYLRKKS